MAIHDSGSFRTLFIPVSYFSICCFFLLYLYPFLILFDQTSAARGRDQHRDGAIHLDALAATHADLSASHMSLDDGLAGVIAEQELTGPILPNRDLPRWGAPRMGRCCRGR